MMGANPVVDLSLDTISRKKQAIVFVNTKRSAEKCAEDISKKIKTRDVIFQEIAKKALGALSNPTKQCKRLARCLESGIAFHHAGLNSKQREIIEDNFKKGNIRVICSTPTLAIGLDLPAYRVIIRDLKRFGHRGLDFIPVLEYLQMAGRAGRPKYDDEGEAIIISQSDGDKELIVEKYIKGIPEDIFSKLAVEPVLRTYVLSLVSTRVVRTKERLIGFFQKTFWAHHYEDMAELEFIIEKILKQLEDWGFIIRSGDDFVSADQLDNDKIRATLLGRRVSELYIDPLTAHFFLTCLKRKKTKLIRDLTFLQMLSRTLEMRPRLKARQKDLIELEEKLVEFEENLIDPEPSPYSLEYEEFLDSFKTSLFFLDWIEEKDEEYLLEKYSIRPGEIRAKLDIADWLLYSVIELSKISDNKDMVAELNKLRVRIKSGVKEELLTLLRLKNVGRVRARKLFRRGFKDLASIRKAPRHEIESILGSKIASDIRQQLGLREKDSKLAF